MRKGSSPDLFLFLSPLPSIVFPPYATHLLGEEEHDEHKDGNNPADESRRDAEGAREADREEAHDQVPRGEANEEGEDHTDELLIEDEKRSWKTISFKGRRKRRKGGRRVPDGAGPEGVEDGDALQEHLDLKLTCTKQS